MSSEKQNSKSNDVDVRAVYEFIGKVNGAIESMEKAQKHSEEAIQKSIQTMGKNFERRIDDLENHLNRNLEDVKERTKKNESDIEDIGKTVSGLEANVENMKEDIKSLKTTKLKTMGTGGASGGLVYILFELIKSQLGK